jgi:hypothetical protein
MPLRKTSLKGVAAYDAGNYAMAFREFQILAKKGEAAAQFNLGLMYANGHGVAQNYKEALNWYRKAAIQGDANAQSILGDMYRNGDGVAQDYKEAVNWYRKAAMQGNANAQSNMGTMFANGDGVAQDYKEAVNWYRKAAMQGSANAQRNLGVMYEKGWGVAENYVMAYALFNTAAVTHDGARENRSALTKKLTPSQIEAGQALTRRMLAVGIDKALNEVNRAWLGLFGDYRLRLYSHAEGVSNSRARSKQKNLLNLDCAPPAYLVLARR